MNENPPLISVILPTYNGEKYLAEAIDSVLYQTFKNFELLIIDDGSIDNTENIVFSYKDKRIKYIKKSVNSGIADSLNLGISNAQGKYIARMDGDDVCMPERFSEQLKVLESNSEIIVCGTGVYINNYSEIHFNPEHHIDILLKLLFFNPIVHPTVMMRKEVLLEEMYSLDKVPSEDLALWSRLIFKGRFYNIQKPLLYYRDHELSETNKKRNIQLKKNLDIIIEVYKKLDIYQEKWEEFIKIYTLHDYSINGKKLKELINWFEVLGDTDRVKELFGKNNFEIACQKLLRKFIKSYFYSKNRKDKFKVFIYLPFKYKAFIIRYYLNRIF